MLLEAESLTIYASVLHVCLKIDNAILLTFTILLPLFPQMTDKGKMDPNS